jgi:Flp pilus assembly protein TadG
MLEFALSAILLITVIFGVMAISVALYSYNVVSEAAREGTRYAIVRGKKCNSFASACPAKVDGSDVQAYLRSLSFPGIKPANLTAASVYSSVDGRACTPSAACNNPGNQVKVTVTYSFPLVIPFVPARTLSMTNSAQMVISQ